MLLRDAVDDFLNYQRNRKSRAETTITTYRSMLGFFVSFAGNIRVEQITVRLIDCYADSLHLKPKSLKNRLTAVRSLIAWLYSRNYIDIRPQSVDIPCVPETEANFLDYNEQHALVEACCDTRERALVLLLLRSGLRISEAMALRRDDVFERSIVVRHGKGDKPRLGFLTEEAAQALDHYLQESESDYCFSSELGKPLSRQYAHRMIVTVADRAGIKKSVHPHTLRHTFATNMLRAGARIEDVQKMLGHKKVQTTLIYMHFTDEYLQSRYEEFAEVERPLEARLKLQNA